MKNLVITLIGVVSSIGIANAKSPDFNEANALGMKYMNSRFFSGCKNNAFIFKHSTNLTSVQTNYFQVLEPVTTIFEGPKVTEIDRLNGLEWRGGARLNFKAIRLLQNKESWTDWVQRANGFTMLIEKRKGKWEIGGSWDGYFEDAGSCNELPSLRDMASSPSAAQLSPPTESVKPLEVTKDSRNSVGDNQVPNLNCTKPANFIEKALCNAL